MNSLATDSWFVSISIHLTDICLTLLASLKSNHNIVVCSNNTHTIIVPVDMFYQASSVIIPIRVHRGVRLISDLSFPGACTL